MTTARDFAIAAHGDQLYGASPYVEHLDCVAEILKDFGYTDQVWQDAAYLHDVLEDTKTRYEDLVLAFGPKVTKLVDAVSGYGANRKERQTDIIHKLHNHKEACVLKLADRIANLEAAIQERNAQGKFAMYEKELKAFSKVVKKHVPERMWMRLEDAFAHGKERGWC